LRTQEDLASVPSKRCCWRIVCCPGVPDILGKKWQGPDSVVVIGSAYAPFVPGTANRANAMTLANYVNARTWQDFQRAFVPAVVENERSYYGPLSALAGATGNATNCSGLALFDSAA
jgi:hypothetical protein